MIAAETFVGELEARGIRTYSGVPCSYLTPLINTVIGSSRTDWISATNEGDAVAVASGSELGGRRGVALMQNSGLGNAVSPLTSLNAIFRIPILLVVTWRGRPGGAADEPQHELMGRITPGLLEQMEIPWELAPQDEPDVAPCLDRALAHMDRARTPFALVVPKGTFSGDASSGEPRADRAAGPELPATGAVAVSDPDEILRTVQAAARPDDVVLATTGFTGRALYALADRPNQLYMVGSMGCLSSVGLGLARARPDRRIVVLDGDGAMLMRLGAVAMIGRESPTNLIHVLLDNRVHDSTGSQTTVADGVDLAAVAAASRYARVVRADGPAQLRGALEAARPGPTFVHVRTRPRADRKLPRPTITPAEVAERLRRHLGRTGDDRV